MNHSNKIRANVKVEPEIIKLKNICGNWVSSYQSPPIRIFHDGKRYRLQLSMCNTEFTTTIHQVKGDTFIDLFGRIHLAYDSENEVLALSVEGLYHRDDEF